MWKLYDMIWLFRYIESQFHYIKSICHYLESEFLYIKLLCHYFESQFLYIKSICLYIESQFLYIDKFFRTRILYTFHRYLTATDSRTEHRVIIFGSDVFSRYLFCLKPWKYFLLYSNVYIRREKSKTKAVFWYFCQVKPPPRRPCALRGKRLFMSYRRSFTWNFSAE